MEMRRLAGAAAGLLLGGCGDYVGATGELGHLSYGLSIDYEIDGSLTDVSLITGHTQRLGVSLTPDGEDIARKPWLITHTISPDSGATLTVDEVQEGSESVPGLEVLVTEPDLYILESYYDGELLDYIKVSFERPDAMEILTWIRDPNAEEFTESSNNATISVEVGTQIAMLPVPYAGGERLVGSFAVSYAHTPENAAVTVHNVRGVYEEEGVTGAVNSASLVFVSPETVVVTIEDAANGITAERTFNVAPAGR